MQSTRLRESTRKSHMSQTQRVPLSSDVVEVIQYVKQCRDRALSAEESRECMHDIHTKLCCLLSSIISSPLTGRMFIPSASTMLTSKEKSVSVNEQLGQIAVP